ncbi:MAG: DUF2283 domain-containing protein [Syntrophomonadaceae bacterium]|nr:DUF2283 domain-containing protein [Syntrophomonadaceae bacterium]
MKLSYYPETDSLYIELSERPSADSEEVAPGVVLDYDTEGRIVGIDIDNASKASDLSVLEAISLPLTKTTITQSSNN